MKRISVLGSLLIVGTLSATLAAVQQGRQGAAGAKPVPFGQETPSADALMVEKVKPNFYVLRGGGGNTAAFITEAGGGLVDTKLPGWGQPLIQKLKTITPKPVTTARAQRRRPERPPRSLPPNGRHRQSSLAINR